MKCLVAIDIDGTLLSTRDGAVPSGALDALVRVRENGHIPVIATGRGLAMTRKYADMIGARHIIAADGALIVSDGETLRSRRFEIVSNGFLRSMDKAGGISIIGVCPEKVYIRNCDELLTAFMYNQVNDENLICDIGETAPPLNMLGIWGDGVEKVDYSLLSRDVDVKFSQGSFTGGYTSICVKGIDKGGGLDFLASRLGISMADTCAIGDADNDISILKASGFGIAMGNAPEAVKRAADFVTAHVDDNGLAKALASAGLI